MVSEALLVRKACHSRIAGKNFNLNIHTHDHFTLGRPSFVSGSRLLKRLHNVNLSEKSGRELNTSKSQGRRSLLQRCKSAVDVNAHVERRLANRGRVKLTLAHELDDEILRVTSAQIKTSGLQHQAFKTDDCL